MRRHDPGANWPMSSVSMARTIATLIAYPFRTARSCGPSNTVAPPAWEATWSSATCVALNTPPMTLAETAPPRADQSMAKVRWLEKQKSELFARWGLPPGLHPKSRTQPSHPGKQKSLVSSFVSSRLRDSLSLRSHSSSGNPRLYLSSPYLEPTTPRPLPPPLPHPPRSSVFRSNSLDPHPQKLPLSCRTPQHRLPWQVPRLSRKGFRTTETHLPRQNRSPGRFSEL